MVDNSKFKEDLWDAIEDIFYEYNVMYNSGFGRKDLEEAIEDHADYFENDTYYDPSQDHSWEDSPYSIYINKFSFQNEPEFTSKKDAIEYLTDLGTWALFSHRRGHDSKKGAEDIEDLAVKFSNNFVDKNGVPESTNLTVRYNYLNDFLTYMFNIEDNSY